MARWRASRSTATSACSPAGSVPPSFEEEIVDRNGNLCELLTTKSVHAMTATSRWSSPSSLDITERKRAELDLLAVKEQAEPPTAARPSSSPI